jgi:putative PIN family toxin of toxin-antitoxin system
MATELRVVFDTSTAVSAVLLPRSVSRQAFDLASDSGKLLLSEETLSELDEVLRRPKFDKYVSRLKRQEFLLALLEIAEVVRIDQRIVACRDPEDDKFLELAVAGRASHIVSGDGDLRSLNPFQGISILTASEFLSSVAK